MSVRFWRVRKKVRRFERELAGGGGRDVEFLESIGFSGRAPICSEASCCSQQVYGSLRGGSRREEDGQAPREPTRLLAMATRRKRRSINFRGTLGVYRRAIKNPTAREKGNGTCRFLPFPFFFFYLIFLNLIFLRSHYLVPVLPRWLITRFVQLQFIYFIDTINVRRRSSEFHSKSFVQLFCNVFHIIFRVFVYL